MPHFMQQQPGQTRDGEPMPGTILVVEDEVLIRLMISEYLREFGYTVLEAKNGDEAAKLLHGGDEVDVVFSDVRMPGRIDGLALAKWIARNRPEIGVLLTSAYVPPADLADSGAAVSSLVRKPYTPGEVLSRIRELTGAAA
jgi:CheY-like chemotaxis protein